MIELICISISSDPENECIIIGICQWWSDDAETSAAYPLRDEEYAEPIKTISIIIVGTGQWPIAHLPTAKYPKKTVLVFVIMRSNWIKLK